MLFLSCLPAADAADAVSYLITPPLRHSRLRHIIYYAFFIYHAHFSFDFIIFRYVDIRDYCLCSLIVVVDAIMRR